MRPARAAAIAAGAALAAAWPAGAAAQAPPPPDAGAVTLSDGLGTTRWAHAVVPAPIRPQPGSASAPTGRLRLLTEDGFPEVYPALGRRTDGAGRAWIRLRLPGRPAGRTGWVRREALDRLHLVRTRLEVDRARLRITLWSGGRVRFRAPVGVGAPATPTPAGSFWIRERFHVPGNGLYGTRAMGTSAYSDALTDWPGGGVIGLHGTNEPALIPGRPSHGCIRLRNGDIKRLYARTPLGTPVVIR